MKTDTKIIIGAIVASLFILVGAVAAFSSTDKPQRENLGSSGMTIDKKFEDFGDMKVDEDRTAVFTITNTSDSVLRIWNIATSCDCTFATLMIDGKPSPEFNMPGHMPKSLTNWIGEVAAGTTATLNVTYKPKVMPVKGVVTRQVTFSTNAPDYETVEVGIKANVL